MGLGINYVILTNQLVSLITSSTTNPRLFAESITTYKRHLKVYDISH